LKGSPNARSDVPPSTAARFGGSDALPDLDWLLDDNDHRASGEAVRAILNIGTEQSYQVRLSKTALAGGTDRSRARRIMQAVSACSTKRAAPCFRISSALEPSRVRSSICVPARHPGARRAARIPKDRDAHDALYAANGVRRAATLSCRPPAPEALAIIVTPEAQAV